MSSRRARTRRGLAAALLAAGLAAGCSSGHHRAEPVVPADAITVDRWSPPAIPGPASPQAFCTALTAIYRHMADLSRVVSAAVAEQYLNDYDRFAPTAIAAAPPNVHASAATYMEAVAGYLRAYAAAGLDLAKLPAGALQPLTTPAANAAFTALSGYSRSECHYTIGGNPTQP